VLRAAQGFDKLTLALLGMTTVIAAG